MLALNGICKIMMPSTDHHLRSNDASQSSEMARDAERLMTPAGPVAIFTICFSNYLAQAQVLAESLVRQHPGMQLTVLLVDGVETTQQPQATLRTIAAASLFSSAEWNHRRCYYSVLELATCIKPACFRHLLDNGTGLAIYLDPDIQLFAPLDLLWSGDGCDSDVTLTPHLLTPLPQDGRLPGDLNIMRAGLYNLGFAAIRDTPASRRLIAWWDNHLRTMCLSDVREGVFTDQKWMDFAPLLVPTARILRHAGCNVAYWNLHERTPQLLDGRWQVKGPDGDWHPLIFFHFSGFNPRGSRLSFHETRFRSNPPGETRDLLTGYARKLTQAGYHAHNRSAPPPPQFAGGMKWDAICRALYREAHAQGAMPENPLSQAFLDWAGGREAGQSVSRYVQALLRLRPDVAAAFPNREDHAGIEAWLRTSGRREMGLDLALLEQVSANGHAGPPAVHLVGYLSAHLGVGEAARNLAAALVTADIPISFCDVSYLTGSPVGEYTLPSNTVAAVRDERPQVTLINCNADVLPDLLRRLPQKVLESYRIGCWYWETPTFPDEWCNRFDLVDEVWVTTHFIADALRAKATVPVVVLPPMVAPPPMQADRSWLTALAADVRTNEFVFLCQFDAASVPYRKNPEGVIDAFRLAFQPDEPVRLILKVLNGDSAPGLMERLRTLSEGLQVSFLEAPLESTDRFRLIASADALVSLHRAEGLGLAILEAMFYGRPVVVTAWSGNMDFTTEANAALVPYDLKPSSEDHGPYPEGTVWAEPRLGEAARQMRRVWTDADWRSAIGLAAAETIASACSAKAAGAAMRDRLLRLAASSRIQGRAVAAQVAAQVQSTGASGIYRPMRRVLRHAWRHPGYYLLRLPRVPEMVWSYALGRLMYRLRGRKK